MKINIYLNNCIKRIKKLSRKIYKHCFFLSKTNLRSSRVSNNIYAYPEANILTLTSLRSEFLHGTNRETYETMSPQPSRLKFLP